MVLPGVHLANRPAHSGTILANYHKQILGNESKPFVRLHDFHMSKTLPVSAYFVLALHDQHTAFAQDSMRLFTGILIQFKDGFVVFLCGSISGAVVAIMSLERRMNRMRSSTRRVHVRRIENYTIYRLVRVRKCTAIHPALDIRGKQFVLPFRDVAPENALPERDIGNPASWRDIEIQDMREGILISAHICAEYQLVGRLTVAHSPACLIGLCIGCVFPQLHGLSPRAGS